MTTPNDLSDKALAVFAYAIYHQLSIGDVITAVAASDAAGHRVDPDAVASPTFANRIVHPRRDFMAINKQDRARVAGGQDHEVKYEAGKTRKFEAGGQAAGVENELDSK